MDTRYTVGPGDNKGTGGPRCSKGTRVVLLRVLGIPEEITTFTPCLLMPNIPKNVRNYYKIPKFRGTNSAERSIAYICFQ